MGFKCGIVGLPNVGKSTLFNLLTSAGVSAENFPFCTLDPNTGTVPIPDPRLTQIAELVNPAKVIPAAVDFVDIAGLVEGASRGEGLGNQFLAHIRETDAIAHVVRCFQDDEITHVADQVDPARDIEIINLELALADIETLEKGIRRLKRPAGSGDREAKESLAWLEEVQAHLNEGGQARNLVPRTESQRQEMRHLHLLTSKPVMYVANVGEGASDEDSELQKVRKIAEDEQAELVVVCNRLEAEIAELNEQDRCEFLQDLGIQESGRDRVIRAGYALLGLQTFFTAGPKEVRAWTLPREAKAPRAAGVIHSDFEEGFIRAEIISFDDFMEFSGEQGARDAGRWRLEGRDYLMQDGDVVHFRFNPKAGAVGKK